MKTLLTLSSEQGIDIPWERILSAGSDIQYASHKSFDYIIDIQNVHSAFCSLYIGNDYLVPWLWILNRDRWFRVEMSIRKLRDETNNSSHLTNTTSKDLEPENDYQWTALLQIRVFDT